jgi:hypothetical protein
MEEGLQKSKRLSYIAQFKREVVPCTEKRNHKAAAISGVESKHKAVIRKCEVS